MTILTCVALLLISSVHSQLAGNVKKNEFPPLPITEMGRTIQSAVVIDSNWRWIHNKDGYTNCYDSTSCLLYTSDAADD